MADGFLGRWAKRKEAVRKGMEVPAEPVKLAPRMPAPEPVPAQGAGEDTLARGPGGGGGDAVPAPPTQEDVASLTHESDFSRYAKADVPPQVRNAAMKKLFSDPHFNVMDGLDVYIDDYNKPDPMPAGMARQLASSGFLKLFDTGQEEPGADESTTGRDVSDVPRDQSVAQSGTGAAEALPPAGQDADPDLRLQQDDAPGCQEPRAGPR